MKRMAILAGLIVAVIFSGTVDAGAASKNAQRARMKRLLDTDGDGVVSIPERGAGRLIKGANRQQRAMNKNERAIRGIK